MKFRYDLDRMIDEKRPFGNSGFNQIQKDMMEIISEKKTWNVSNENELDESKWKWMEDCFKEVNDWIKDNREDFKIKIFAQEKNDERGEQ